MMSKSKIKKIIYLLDNLFCKRDYERFGIELLKVNGFEVLVWDLTAILNPDIYYNITVPDPIEYEGYKLFSEVSAVCNDILNMGNDCLFLFFADYTPKIYPILRLISRKKLPYCIDRSGDCRPILTDYIEETSKPITMKAALLQLMAGIKKITYKSLKVSIFVRLPYRLLNLRPADFIIGGAAKSNMRSYRFPVGPKTKILNIHYYDYDNYVAERRKKNVIDKFTGVFLDQYIPFHPDNLLYDPSSEIEEEEYYPYLRNFFDYLEATFKVKIIIAAHPRAHYENYSDYFGGRPVIRNKTCELVSKAGFVLAHHSFSLNYAVLFNQPILFLTTDKMQKREHGVYINLMATILGKSPIFIDKPYNIDWEKEKIVDNTRYYEYKQRHIKMEGSEELSYWQVVANYINNNY